MRSRVSPLCRLHHPWPPVLLSRTVGKPLVILCRPGPAVYIGEATGGRLFPGQVVSVVLKLCGSTIAETLTLGPPSSASFLFLFLLHLPVSRSLRSPSSLHCCLLLLSARLVFSLSPNGRPAIPALSAWLRRDHHHQCMLTTLHDSCQVSLFVISIGHIIQADSIQPWQRC